MILQDKGECLNNLVPKIVLGLYGSTGMWEEMIVPETYDLQEQACVKQISLNVLVVHLNFFQPKTS